MIETIDESEWKVKNFLPKWNAEIREYLLKVYEILWVIWMGKKFYWIGMEKLLGKRMKNVRWDKNDNFKNKKKMLFSSSVMGMKNILN